MIRADIGELEGLTHTLVGLASDCDEVFNRLRLLSSQMSQDVELQTYPQAKAVLEAASAGVQALNRGNDTLQSLQGAMLPVAELYREMERKHRLALERMTVWADHLNTGYGAAIYSQQLARVEHTAERARQLQVQQLVAQNVEQLQAANLAAVTRVVRETYQVSRVEPLEQGR